MTSTRMHGVGYRKKGYPKQEPKRLLRTSQISKPKDNHRVSADSPTRPKPASQRLSTSSRPSRAEAPLCKASDGLPILRFARGPASEASDEVPILRLARGRLGNNLVASASTDFSDKMSRVQPLPRRQPHVGAVQQGGRRDVRQDETGVTGHCAQHCTHAWRPYCTVLPNSYSRSSTAWGSRHRSL